MLLKMSQPETTGKSSRPSSNGKGSYRRRRPTSSKGPRAPKPKSDATESKPAAAEPAEKKERPETVPVPENLFGTQQTGTVVITIRNRKFNFGFISLAKGEKAEDLTVPRVYYNPSLVKEKGLYLYRGYEVTFTVEKDENGRTIAKDIELTEEGKTIKTQRDAEAALKREARAAERAAEAAKEAEKPKKKEAPKKAEKKAAAPAGDKPARAPREKRTANFEVTVEGDASKTGTVTDFVITQSIGRLKSLAAKAVDASMELSVYLVNDENPTGVFLTRAVLNTVGESGKLLLAPKREADNLEK